MRVVRIPALAVALACAGCMTLDTLNNRGYRGPYAYSGSRSDLKLIGQSFLSWNVPFMLLFMIDLPFCAVADTLALPATLPRERVRLAELKQRQRVDIEQPALVRATTGEEPEVTAQRLFERCREASKLLSAELLDCYSIAARITLRPESGAAPRQLSGGAYKLELREALARQRYLGDVVDWIEADFERQAGAVRVTAARSTARSPVTHPQSWLIGPGDDGGWRILEEDGIDWADPPPAQR